MGKKNKDAVKESVNSIKSLKEMDDLRDYVVFVASEVFKAKNDRGDVNKKLLKIIKKNRKVIEALKSRLDRTNKALVSLNEKVQILNESSGVDALSEMNKSDTSTSSAAAEEKLLKRLGLMSSDRDIPNDPGGDSDKSNPIDIVRDMKRRGESLDKHESNASQQSILDEVDDEGTEEMREMFSEKLKQMNVVADDIRSAASKKHEVDE